MYNFITNSRGPFPTFDGPCFKNTFSGKVAVKNLPVMWVEYVNM